MEPISALVASVVAIIVALGASYAFVLRLGSKDGQLRGEVAALRAEVAALRGDLVARISELDDNLEAFKKEQGEAWSDLNRSLGWIEGQLSRETSSPAFPPGPGRRK